MGGLDFCRCVIAQQLRQFAFRLVCDRHDLLDQLAGNVLEVLRHHDFQQAGFFCFGHFGDLAGELA
ncbi:hypothetical protein D3C81_1916890 [compost metagenome]